MQHVLFVSYDQNVLRAITSQAALAGWRELIAVRADVM
jgi:hypothetical protein